LGKETDVVQKCGGVEAFDNVIDAKRGCVIPGLIDGHTHPVWAGDRVHEFAMKVHSIIHLIKIYI
jgi:imidazolonepropionase